MKRLFIALILLLATSQSWALEAVVAKVVLAEPTYLPNTVSFQLAGGTASCPAGTWLRWQRDADNNKAVYATLLAAMVSGKSVRFYVDDGDTSCVGRYLHLISDS